MKAELVQDIQESGPGCYQFVYRADEISGIAVNCPGCGQSSFIPFGEDKEIGEPGWNLISKEPISVSPSIHHDIKSCGWHGWLKNGEFSQ